MKIVITQKYKIKSVSLWGGVNYTTYDNLVRVSFINGSYTSFSRKQQIKEILNSAYACNKELVFRTMAGFKFYARNGRRKGTKVK